MPRKPTPGKTSQIKIANDTTKNPAAARMLTSERIANDLEAFSAAGGIVEVLGITRVLTPSEQAKQPRPAAHSHGNGHGHAPAAPAAPVPAPARANASNRGAARKTS
jgi:hypothetical protein